MRKPIQGDTLEAFKYSSLNISELVRVLGILDDPSNYILQKWPFSLPVVL